MNSPSPSDPSVCPARHGAAPDWQAALPAASRPQVVVPLRFSSHSDADAQASRCLGYDAGGRPCYYQHAYTLAALCSDDDEDFYEACAYDEEVRAWRLADARWLVWRAVRRDQDCRGRRAAYSYADQMPR